MASCVAVRGDSGSELRQKVLTVAASQIGTTEKTGRNDGEVEKYLVSVGLSKGDPYCAAFVYWCGREALGASNPYPRTGWSPSMVNGGLLVKSGAIGCPGDAWGIYFPKLQRVAHTGLVAEWGSVSVITIEANTAPQSNSGDQRNGDGVWKKKRLKASLYRVKDWIK